MKRFYINKERIDMMRIDERLGDYYFYRLSVKFKGEKGFREVMRSFDAETCERVMESLKNG